MEPGNESDDKNPGSGFKETLARIDERTKAMETRLKSVEAGMEKLQDVAELKIQLAHLKDEQEDLKAKMEKFVTQTEFKPVRMVVFGMVSSILLAVLGAIVGLVLKN